MLNEVQLFVRVAGDNPLRQWLVEQKAVAVKTLVAAQDMNTINRAQGAYQLAERQLLLLDKAKDLR